MGTVLVASIAYLVLHQDNPTFLGSDFTYPVGWQRIEAAIVPLLQATVQPTNSCLTGY